jgi:NAD(P)-dependent dehydrogenase (short-subunit alcohol dehydrogenase family)
VSLLAGKVALVTGAGSGLGREYALAFVRHGARVLVNDLGATVAGEAANERSADAVVREILALGGEAAANYSSVADWAGAERMVTEAVARFGRLDVVVNNAGINRPSSLVDLRERDADLQLEVHLKGTLAVSHFAAQWWARQPHEAGRAIINTTSAVGLHPVAGGGVYGAAKAGIVALTLSHAQELARYGVRVNAVAPCARTRMVKESPEVLALMPKQDGFDRHAPEHIAPLVVYLASEACDFTGRVFAIEGPDVAVYHPFGVEHHFSTEGAWTVDGLTATFAGVSRTSEVDAFFPGGVTKHHTPPRRTQRQIADDQR